MLNTWAKESVCEYGILFFKETHINNNNTDRPANKRESLSLFFKVTIIDHFMQLHMNESLVSNQTNNYDAVVQWLLHSASEEYKQKTPKPEVQATTIIFKTKWQPTKPYIIVHGGNATVLSDFATHDLNFCHFRGVAGCLNQCLSSPPPDSLSPPFPSPNPPIPHYRRIEPENFNFFHKTRMKATKESRTSLINCHASAA